jgi:hypothetical protein
MCVTAPLSEFCRGDLIFYDPDRVIETIAHREDRPTS